MGKPQVKIAVVGASGLIGRRHLQHVLEEEDAGLSAIIDPSSLAAELAVQYKSPHYFDVTDFLKSVKAGKCQADAVILATPTHTHASLAKELVAEGLAVLVEKPLAVNGAEGRDLLESYSSSKKGLIMVGHHRRHNAYAMTVRNLIKEGQLGKVVAVNGVWAMRKPMEYFAIPWRQQAGSGGVVLTNAIHEIDILRFLLGDIAEVYAIEGAKERSFPVDETVQVTLKFTSGAVGSFLWSDTAASPNSWEAATGENPTIPATGETCLTVFGTKGSIGIPALTRFHYEKRPEQEQNWTFPLAKDESPKEAIDQVPPFTRQLKHFIKAIRGEAEPDCSAQDGLKAVLVMEAIFKSLETHAPVTVEQS